MSTAGTTAEEPTDVPSDVPADVPTDLTWLLHRSARRLRVALDEVAAAHGLSGVRDWLVLSALVLDPGRTQLALAHSLSLDKTTLTTLLDRLERADLVVRRADPTDRRARIPQITDAGRRVQEQVTTARDEVEARLLSSFSPAEQALLRDLLTRLATQGPATCTEVGGSCM